MSVGLDASIPRYPARFRAKVLGSILAVSLLSAAAAFGMYLWRARRLAVSDWDARGRRLATELARDAQLGLFAGNVRFVEPSVEEIAQEPDVLYVSVVEPDGAELIRKTRSAATKVPDITTDVLDRTKQDVLVRSLGSFREFVAPVYGGGADGPALAYGGAAEGRAKLLGWVRIGLSDARVRRDVRRAVVGSLVLGGLVLAIGVLFGLVVSRPLTSPIRRLSAAVEELRKGNLDHRVEVRSKDELGQLADSFNRMAWSLRESLSELERLNRSLEREVSERTEAIRRLSEFVQRLNGPRRIRPLVEEALDGLCRLCDADAAVFYLVGDAEGRRLRAHAGHGVGAGALGPVEVEVGRSELGVACAADGVTVLSEGDLVHRASMALGKKVAAIAAVPVRFGDRLQGLAVLLLSEEPGEDDLGLLEQAAGQLGIALANARAFEAAERLARELERRNKELQRQRDVLQRQKEKLEETNRLKSEFLANTTHELRTPLNAIIGYAQLLLEGVYGPITEEQREALKAIDESAQNLLGLINQTLDYAKLEAGQMPIVVSQVDAAELCRDVVRASKGLTRDRPYDVVYRGPEGPVPIRTDEAKLRQILLNLVSNAVKFTEKGSVEVVLEPRADGGIDISVRDTGIGIAREHWEVIFEAFRQVDGSSTRQAGGTGLGLAITKSLVELLGGRITLDSEVGRGSVFTVHLPPEPPARAVEAERARVDDLAATMGVADDLDLVDVGTGADTVEAEVDHDFTVDQLGLDLVDMGEEGRRPGSPGSPQEGI